MILFLYLNLEKLCLLGENNHKKKKKKKKKYRHYYLVSYCLVIKDIISFLEKVVTGGGKGCFVPRNGNKVAYNIAIAYTLAIAMLPFLLLWGNSSGNC